VQTLLNKLRRIRPGNILAVLFLAYLGFVACSALPRVSYELGRCLYWQTGIQEFINAVDEHSEDLLSLEQDKTLLLNKGSYINLNGLMAKLMGQPEINDRLMLTNGHLSTLPGELPDEEKIREATERILRLYEAQTASGGNFLFVMAPVQIDKYEDLLPVGYEDTINGPADTFLTLLQEAGVPCLDLREEMHKDGISVTDAYYVTDHHWTLDTGFWAYRKILNKLEQMQIIDPVDPFYTNPENYTFATHEDVFLGSSGKRTGIYYGGLDDFEFIYPNFETDISVSVPSEDYECRGPYEEVSYHQRLEYDLEDPDYFNTNFYALYGWNDTPITHWRNEHAADQNKFLLIGDSFSNIPFSLMSLNLGIMDEVDVRYFEGNFSDYYYDYRPDTVILEFNSAAIIAEFTYYDYIK